MIRSVTAVPGVSGFFFDDQAAIKAGATQDGFAYTGDPVTPGFDRVRQPGAAISVLLELDDGSIVHGDCAAVQYSGAGGRDPLFDPERYIPVIEGPVARELVGRDPRAFEANADAIESLRVDGDRLHTAIRYGVSQALLAAAAAADRTTMTDVLADALGTTPATRPIPVFGQSGDDRRLNAEKMLIKGVPVLPHGLFNSEAKIGRDGDRLLEYLAWLSDRTSDLGPPGYEPTFHVDVYGMFGELWGPPYDDPWLLDYLDSLAVAAAPFPLQIEGPMDEGGRAEQIHAMTELRDALASAGVPVDLVADEWCNTYEDVVAFVDAGAADLVQVKTPDLGGVHRSARAVQYCEGTDTRAYLGGTCNETATSARACVHVGLATDAAQLLAKPGMGFDEGFMVVTNEMQRTLTRRRTATEEATINV